MQHPYPSSSDSRDLSASQVVSGLVLASVLGLMVATFVNGSWTGEHAPFPYAWRDVAIIQILCSLPLACFLAGLLRQRVSAVIGSLFAASLLLASILPLSGDLRARMMATLIADPSVGILLRALPALGMTLSVILAAAILAARSIGLQQRVDRFNAIALASVGMVVLFLVPWTYVGARCRHDVAKLNEYREQSRFGEANVLAHGLLVLDAGLKSRGRPMPEVSADMGRIVRDLEARVKPGLGFQANTGARLERATQLAMLDRTDEAIRTMQSVRDPEAAPFALNLLGTIHETRGEWDPALDAYQRARLEWEAQPPSPRRSHELLRSITGTAYCQRKKGNYVEAEASYRQLLTLSETAESHYLLAQFYEDTQQAEKARLHARRAMKLAPDRYQRDGERLINKLAVHHFGCLGIFAAERD